MNSPQCPQSAFYRDQLRSARAAVLADAEGFQAVLNSLELMGLMRTNKVGNLKAYERELFQLANRSSLAADIPSEWPRFHTKFCALYEEFRHARNDAAHQGAHARFLADHAVELTIILEDALMLDAVTIAQFMVRDVVEGKLWQPISYVRQQMLKHAFSYLPVRVEKTWHLIPEYLVARYLREKNSSLRKKRLATQLGDAFGANKLELPTATIVDPSTPIEQILSRIGEQPILVVDPDHEDTLAGVLTASDIL